MKITVKDGRVTAEAETVADLNALMTFAEKAREPKGGHVAKGYKHRARTCRVCGKQYRYTRAHKRSCATPVPVQREV